MWNSTGKVNHKKPSLWFQKRSTKELIEKIEEKGIGRKSDLLKTTKGRYGGTFAHWQIASAYAKYLSADLHIEFNKYIKTYIVEEAYPEKGIVRNIENYKKKYKRLGKSDEWINTRLIGITQRNDFTSTIGKIKNLGNHGYGMITDDINLMILGETAKNIKKKTGVKQTRDGLSPSQLMLISLAEELAAKALNEKSIECISKGEAIDTMLDSIQKLSEVAEPLKFRN